ncbi:MAG: DUF1553 domain-containing protein, partial [Verrucomicrobiaceae bacterium]|nr:DUF1553 domain-containing protein [Verrucomicrobiaceae bacterium]
RANLTNTPLHALTLLNDTGMLEASRALADAVVALPDSDSDSALDRLALRVLSRELTSPEEAILHRERIQSLDYYESHPDAAIRFATVGQQPPPTRGTAPATAAWMTLASMMLNLDEAITLE